MEQLDEFFQYDKSRKNKQTLQQALENYLSAIFKKIPINKLGLSPEELKGLSEDDQAKSFELLNSNVEKSIMEEFNRYFVGIVIQVHTQAKQYKIEIQKLSGDDK